MKIIEKPWGREYWLEVNDDYAVKRIVINPHNRLSLQFHKEKKETLVVVSGTLYASLQIVNTNKEIEYHETLIGPGGHLTVYPFTTHRYSAKDEIVELIECSTPQLQDVERIEDDYNRK